MIRLIEALNFRCLRHVSRPLDPFHVLVGPNASGKTSFLDTVSFLGRLVSDGVEAAVSERTANFQDLVWGREGQRFELAVEADIPPDRQPLAGSPSYGTIRYEIALGLDQPSGEVRIVDEQIVLLGAPATARRTGGQQWTSLLSARDLRSGKILVAREHSTLIIFRPESQSDGEPPPRAAAYVKQAPSRRSILEQLSLVGPEAFPASAWLAEHLERGIQRVELDSRALRTPSPPGKRLGLLPNGSGLPWVAAAMRARGDGRFKEWVGHLRTALPDLIDVEIVERPEDKHRYLMLVYANGLKVPSWMLSDGTLRLLALTIIPYATSADDIWLIEEPEISIHPLNIESAMQSLQSVYEGQVLVATHSPTVLALVKPENVLVFSATAESGTNIVRGNDHPGLRDWHGEVSLGTLFAGGVLG